MLVLLQTLVYMGGVKNKHPDSWTETKLRSSDVMYISKNRRRNARESSSSRRILVSVFTHLLQNRITSESKNICGESEDAPFIFFVNQGISETTSINTSTVPLPVGQYPFV